MSVMNADGRADGDGVALELTSCDWLFVGVRSRVGEKRFVDWLLLTYPSVRLVGAAFLNQLQQQRCRQPRSVKLRKMLFMIVAAVHRANAPPMVLVVTVAYE